MNEIIKAMEERRSIRKFKPDMPTKEDLEQIIEAGLYAANGMGKQATITIAVTNKKLRDRLSAINAKIGGWKEGFDPFYGAPAILIVLADKNWANRVYDGSLVMGNTGDGNAQDPHRPSGAYGENSGSSSPSGYGGI